MTNLVHEAGASFLRAFIGALIVLIPGILAAPNVTEATAMAWAASAASIIAGLKALQVFVPSFSIGYLLTKLVGAWNAAWEPIEDSFVRAFVGSFLTLIVGAFAAPDFGTGKSLAIAALIGAVTAGIRAIQGALTPAERPAPQGGFTPPPPRAHTVAPHQP